MDHPTFDPTQRASRAAALMGGDAMRTARPGRTVGLARLAGAVLTLCIGAVGVVAGALPAAAFAQESGGPIVIPGPGEKNPAALADMAAHLQASTAAPRAPAAASLNAATAQTVAPAPLARDADAFTRAANASGSIVIPGSDEAPAAPAMIKTSFKPDANGVVTIPPPSATQPAAANGLVRVNMAPASRLAVVPVVVSRAATSSASAATDVAAVQPVAVNPPAGGGFVSLSSRGEPPQLGANGKAIAMPSKAVTQTASIPAGAATLARVPATRTPVAAAAIQPQTQQIQQAQPVQRPAAPTPAAVAPLPGQQDAEAIRSAAQAFLQQQAAGLPGKVEITVAPAFPRGLASCTTLEPFLPSGARMWGRMTVGVRCAGERPWTIYLQARVSLHATYYLAARAMAPGEVLGAADLVARDGDLAGLPQAVVTDPAEAIGSVSLTRIAGGMPLRRDMLRSASAVTIGQTVKVVAAGDGFAISAEGSVMNNASPGQQVRVKTANGQIISGVVKDGSTVEIQL